MLKITHRLHEKVIYQHNDYLIKLNTEILQGYDIICSEDININGMLRNHKLVKSIYNCIWD